MKKILIVFAMLTGAFSAWATEGYTDLTKLVKSGVGEEIILAYINASPINYPLTPEEIMGLKDAGASSKVITTAIEHKKPVNAMSAAASNETAKPAPQPRSTDNAVVYEAVPPSGGWVLLNNYWYWQYPSGGMIDLGWQPYYYFHDRWVSYRHGGGGWGHRGGRGRWR